jgi:hypothetical protein
MSFVDLLAVRWRHPGDSGQPSAHDRQHQPRQQQGEGGYTEYNVRKWAQVDPGPVGRRLSFAQLVIGFCASNLTAIDGRHQPQ